MESEEQPEVDATTLRARVSMLSEASVRINESLDMRTLIDTLPVGVVVVDAKAGTLASVNQEARRLANDLMTPGQTMERLLKSMTVRRGDGRQISLEELSITQATSKGETIRAEEVVFQVPDGRRVSALINATPIFSENGAAESVVVTLQDLTTLQEFERRRGELLANVSHELRTPLAAIKGAASTALGATTGRDDAGLVQFFHIVNEQADSMSGLIKDLLHVARIETGTLRVDPQPETVGDLVEQARDAFVDGIGGTSVHVDLPPVLPRVMADRQRIVQVIGILLSSASGYSPDASPVRITAVQDGPDLAICVADQGGGLSAERMPNLFRKFTGHAGGEAADGDVEPGRDLAICRVIVEAHGGRIWANSEGLDSGIRITFTLPTVEEDLSKSGPLSAADDARKRPMGQEPASILVVDSDPQTLRDVSNLLAGQGYLPCTTGNPQDIPGLVEKHRPSLVLLDLVLPGVDGVAVMTEIVANPDLPVIFLSAYAHEEAIARAFDAGAADYVVKPYAPAELAARIRAALRRRAGQEHGDQDAPFVLGELRIDYKRREVSVGGRPVRLTRLEYRLMVVLSINAGRLVTYEELLRRVWDALDASDTRRVRTAVKKIRRKLGDRARSPTYIINQPGSGYRLRDAATP